AIPKKLAAWEDTKPYRPPRYLSPSGPRIVCVSEAIVWSYAGRNRCAFGLISLLEIRSVPPTQITMPTTMSDRSTPAGNLRKRIHRRKRKTGVHTQAWLMKNIGRSSVSHHQPFKRRKRLRSIVSSHTSMRDV